MGIKTKYKVPDELAEQYKTVSLHNQKGNVAAARELLLQMLEHAPNHPVLLNDIANTYYRQSDYAIAEGKYLEIIELFPDYPVPYTNLCLLYAVTECIDKAIIYADLAMSRGLKLAGTWRTLGIYYANIKNIEVALEYFKTAIVIDPDYLPAYYDAGCIFLLMGNMQEAYIHLRRAFEDHELYRIALTDNDLDIVRNDPVFSEILETARLKFEGLEAD